MAYKKSLLGNEFSVLDANSWPLSKLFCLGRGCEPTKPRETRAIRGEMAREGSFLQSFARHKPALQCETQVIELARRLTNSWK